MAQVTMDIEQVRQFGNDLKGRFCQELQQLKSNVQNQSNNLQWEGPDAQQFKGERTNGLVQGIDQLISRLEELASIAIQNANAQEQVSNQA